MSLWLCWPLGPTICDAVAARVVDAAAGAVTVLVVASFTALALSTTGGSAAVARLRLGGGGPGERPGAGSLFMWPTVWMANSPKNRRHITNFVIITTTTTA